MILIRKHDESTGDASGLEYVEHGQAFGNGEPVVKFVMDNLIIKPKSARHPKMSEGQK